MLFTSVYKCGGAEHLVVCVEPSTTVVVRAKATLILMMVANHPAKYIYMVGKRGVIKIETQLY